MSIPAAITVPERCDLVEVTGIAAWGRHGALAAEQEIGQAFTVDLGLHLSTATAARTDDLTATVNYAEAAALALEAIQGRPHQLIETLAEQIAQAVLALSPRLRAVTVTVHKPAAPVGLPVGDVRVRITRQADPVEAVLAVGTNLGDRVAHLERVLELLDAADGVQVTWTGPVVETDPVGGPAQGAYLNSVIGLRTTRSPEGLLDLAHALEQDAHRERVVRWGARTLDVDVIAWGTLQQNDDTLTLPHPRAHERAFVLAPWVAARPTATLPGHGAIAALLDRAADRDGVRPGPEIPGYGCS